MTTRFVGRALGAAGILGVLFLSGCDSLDDGSSSDQTAGAYESSTTYDTQPQDNSYNLQQQQNDQDQIQQDSQAQQQQQNDQTLQDLYAQ